MSPRQKLIDHLATLERERDEAFKLGQWRLVDVLGQCIDDTHEDIKRLEFNATVVAGFITARGYQCAVNGNTVIVQDPVYVDRGAAAGRFVEFKAVTLRTDADARRFLSARS